MVLITRLSIFQAISPTQFPTRYQCTLLCRLILSHSVMCLTVPELTVHIPTHAKVFCLVDEALKLRRLLLSPRPFLHSFWLAPFSPFFSSLNWCFREQNVRASEENACTAGNVQDVRAADIRLASFTLARVACLLQLWIKTSHFFFISSFLKTLYLGTRLVLSPGGEGGRGSTQQMFIRGPEV